MKYLLSLLLLCFCVMTEAQKSKQTKSYLMPQIGVLDGDHSTSFQFQVVGGIQKNNWQFGIGTGLDYYKIRSLPLFLDTRYFFGKDKRAFAVVNLGYSIPWPLEEQYKIVYLTGGNIKSEFEMGLYTDVGIGYQIPLGKKQLLSFSLGYSVKKNTEIYDRRYDWIWGWPVPQPGSLDNERRMDYTFRRLSFKTGVRLW